MAKRKNVISRKAITEYTIIIVLIALTIAIITSNLGGYIKDGITKISCYLSGDTYVEEPTKGESYCKDEE